MVEIKIQAEGIQLEINIQLLHCDKEGDCPKGVKDKIVCNECMGCENLKPTGL